MPGTKGGQCTRAETRCPPPAPIAAAASTRAVSGTVWTVPSLRSCCQDLSPHGHPHLPSGDASNPGEGSPAWEVAVISGLVESRAPKSHAGALTEAPVRGTVSGRKSLRMWSGKRRPRWILGCPTRRGRCRCRRIRGWEGSGNSCPPNPPAALEEPTCTPRSPTSGLQIVRQPPLWPEVPWRVRCCGCRRQDRVRHR